MLLNPALVDIEFVSIVKPKSLDEQAEEILLARLAAGLRKRVEQGSLSQEEADQQVVAFERALHRQPVERTALVIGDARAMRKAAGALDSLDAEMQKAVDSTNTVSWKKWSEGEDVDTSMAYGEKASPLEYCLGQIAYLHRQRLAASLGASIASGERELDDVRIEFEEILHGTNGNFDFAKADDRRFDAAKLHDKPEPTILLDNKPICTVGNISVIYAKPKAGKSACVSAILASAIAEDEALLGDFLGFSTRRNPHSHALIHIDTEQSRYDHEQIVLRALRRAERDELPSWVRSYCVTDFSSAERRAFLAAEIERAKRECGGVFKVVVDGIGDFIPNVNDPTESHELVLELHALAIRYETILLLVLHENPNDDSQKTRGHLGSQLERKAESNIRIVKDTDGICSVYTERSRHAHITKAHAHCFKWDEALARHSLVKLSAPSRTRATLLRRSSTATVRERKPEA